jgi:hypothetical protein
MRLRRFLRHQPRSRGTANWARFPLALAPDARIYPRVDALARAYGPWWLCNDVTRPFWQSGPPVCREGAGPEREVDMVAIPSRAIAPCPDAALRGTRQRGRGGRVSDPSSLS